MDVQDNDIDDNADENSLQYCTLVKVSEKHSRILNSSTKFYKFKLNEHACSNLDPEEVLLNAFTELGHVVVSPGRENNFFRFYFNAPEFTYPASTSFLQGFQYVADVMIDVLLKISQSGKSLFCGDQLDLCVEEIPFDDLIDPQLLRRFQVSQRQMFMIHFFWVTNNTINCAKKKLKI